MKIDFRGILEGATNSLILKEEVEKAAQARMDICNTCPFNSSNAKKEGYTSWKQWEHCTKCGCTLSMKTRCMSCKCPEDKWLSETDTETDKEITNILK